VSGEKRRQGDKEKRRKGDKETRRQGEEGKTFHRPTQEVMKTSGFERRAMRNEK